jgi:hypothetical protein
MLALELGRVIASGTPQEVVNHPQVVASYLGSNEQVVARSGDLVTTGAGASGGAVASGGAGASGAAASGASASGGATASDAAGGGNGNGKRQRPLKAREK